jgi:hypothetical protein
MVRYSLLTGLVRACLFSFTLVTVSSLSQQQQQHHHQQQQCTTSVGRSSRRAFVLEQTVPLTFATTAFTFVSTVASNNRSNRNHHTPLSVAPYGLQHGPDCSCPSCIIGSTATGASSAVTELQQHGQDCTCPSCYVAIAAPFVKYERKITA